MSDTLGLGKIITTPQERDAVHIAVVPVVAEQDLAPGNHVQLRTVDHEACYAAPGDKEAIGIVDPFLTSRVRKGQRFWLFLYPGSITSLRHDWTHPAFEKAAPQPKELIADYRVAEAMKWIEDFAISFEMSGSQLIEAATAYLQHGEYVTQYDAEDWRGTFDDSREDFWTRYEILTGKKVEDKDVSFFSCSC